MSEGNALGKKKADRARKKRRSQAASTFSMKVIIVQVLALVPLVVLLIAWLGVSGATADLITVIALIAGVVVIFGGYPLWRWMFLRDFMKLAEAYDFDEAKVTVEQRKKLWLGMYVLMLAFGVIFGSGLDLLKSALGANASSPGVGSAGLMFVATLIAVSWFMSVIARKVNGGALGIGVSGKLHGWVRKYLDSEFERTGIFRVVKIIVIVGVVGSVMFLLRLANDLGNLSDELIVAKAEYREGYEKGYASAYSEAPLEDYEIAKELAPFDYGYFVGIYEGCEEQEVYDCSLFEELVMTFEERLGDEEEVREFRLLLAEDNGFDEE